MASERVGANHYGSDRQETGEQKAQHIAMEEKKRLGWEETDLPVRRKGDSGKVRVARRLRQETTMSLKWIADDCAWAVGRMYPTYCTENHHIDIESIVRTDTGLTLAKVQNSPAKQNRAARASRPA